MAGHESSWTPAHASILLPPPIRKRFQREAKNLEQELAHGGVGLLPAPAPQHAGHLIRVSRNPDWYRQLYWKNNHFRRDRSLDALARIQGGRDEPRYGRRDMRNHYDTIYRTLIRDRLVHGYLTDAAPIPPASSVQEYFGLAITNAEEFYAQHYS